MFDGSGVTGTVTTVPSTAVKVTVPVAAGMRKPPCAIMLMFESLVAKFTDSIARIVRSGAPLCHEVVGSCTCVAIWRDCASQDPAGGASGTFPNGPTPDGAGWNNCETVSGIVMTTPVE